MTDRSIVVTDADMEMLTRMVRAFKHSLFRDQQQLERLDQTLAGAEVKPSGRVAKDVIRMNSRVRVFDFDTRTRGLYTLAFPEEADISRGLLSILAPLGIALLGRRRGDVIEAQVPGGARKLRVEGVRQKVAGNNASPSENGSARRERHLRRGYETALAV